MWYKYCAFCGELLDDKNICNERTCRFQGREISKMVEEHKKDKKPFKFNYKELFYE